jgi:hypothetical protein
MQTELNLKQLQYAYSVAKSMEVNSLRKMYEIMGVLHKLFSHNSGEKPIANSKHNPRQVRMRRK